MLIALNASGRQTNLLNSNRQLVQSYRPLPHYCPGCGGEVILKAGRKVIPHFAHKAGGNCTVSAEGESNRHIEGKQSLFSWLKDQGIHVQLELYIPDIKQRTDLYAEIQGKKYAIEFQCSIISSDEVKRRTLGYKKKGMETIWIFHNDLCKQRRHNEFSVPSFIWTAIRGSLARPQAIFLSPKNLELIFLPHMIPFSSATTFSTSYKLSLAASSLQQLILPYHSLVYPTFSWAHKMKAWRMYACRSSAVSDPFFLSIYKAGLNPATFPLEIGLPIPYGHLYETHSVEWQYWLFRKNLYPRDIGDVFTIQEWRIGALSLIREGKINLRPLPFYPAINPFVPADMYLFALIELGVVHSETGDVFQILRPLSLFNPANMGEEQTFYKKLPNLYNNLMKKEEQSYTKKAHIK
ncbi:competence protein CoiA [Bacillus sp. 1P06AnD]|uniref:competence protein CoiA n=1 Tax=Bacillus sp. 1P06AnD TaxID=3132208 RepID=UPI0039A37BCB